MPNLDKWYASTLTVQVLHNRGFNAVAIAMPPVGLTAKQFLAEYPLEDAPVYLPLPERLGLHDAAAQLLPRA